MQKIDKLINEVTQLRKEITSLKKAQNTSLAFDPFRKSVTIARAAQILDKSKYFIYDLINAGKLEKIKIGRSLYVTIESLDEVQTPR